MYDSASALYDSTSALYDSTSALYGSTSTLCDSTGTLYDSTSTLYASSTLYDSTSTSLVLSRTASLAFVLSYGTSSAYVHHVTITGIAKLIQASDHFVISTGKYFASAAGAVSP